MAAVGSHKHTGSVSQNHKAQLANAYNELGKELSSSKIRVVGNYTLGKVIGEGAYGKVRMGTHRITSTRVAIKQIPKAMSAVLTREIHHHRQLHHPHITQMYEVIATESSIWIVTELCCGGELFDYLVEKGRLSEDETRVIFGQLCLAVAYLHQNDIVHRDLKLENVLLDERCRVKLGDFGFTREFEKGTFMETFCGTTGYASPEMLQGKKYQGPEVDVWSLGIILYCLLTGTLPFDDDDESVMRDKIIKGDFEDPVWLSLESRDLIKSILQKDVSKRIMIPQILAHPWFTSRKVTYEPDSPHSVHPPLPYGSSRPHTPEERPRSTDPDSHHSSEASESFLQETVSSTPTTPEETSIDPFNLHPAPSSKTGPSIHRNPSESTIRRNSTSDLELLAAKMARAGERKPDTVLEEQETHLTSSVPRSNSTNSKAPPVHSARMPTRTKRRSVSSNLSDPGSPTTEMTPTPLPIPQARDLDFAGLLSAPAPVIFSTPLERELLNGLSMLGFDTAQMVHSVLTNACDAAGSLWWMLKKKAERERKEINDDETGEKQSAGVGEEVKQKEVDDREKDKEKPKKKKTKVNVGVQADNGSHSLLSLARSAPQLAFVPPTPTFARPMTPPRQMSPTPHSMLSPSSSTVAELSFRSNPSTPGGSMKDKDRDKDATGSKGRKARSGSVSIMQRATTALEAAGLVRKKSSEAVREEKEREREKSREAEREKERRLGSGEDPRPSYGSSASSKLTKSPPLKAKDNKDKDREHIPPSTPPPMGEVSNLGPRLNDSPWVLAESKARMPPELIESHSTPDFTPESTPTQKPAPVPGQRNKANILTAFRLWFNEDRKGKRKEPNSAGSAPVYSRPVGAAQQYTTKRRASGSGSKFGSRGGHKGQRPSMSSHRSSSVNSRRSSGTSAQMVLLDSPQVPPRRSFGSHTPNSERGEYSSRPSSIRSFSMQPRHRKSPSASSAGSITHFRTASPMQKYHRRGGSGSSTRVVRQNVARTPHARSNSAASSIHSPPSSRPTSFYEESDGPRATSPFKNRSRSSVDDTPKRPGSAGGNTTFVAHKRQGPFMSPAGAASRTSWKKSWGLEPPGWQSRAAHLPVEVLAISPATEPTSIRDVFSGKQSLSLGDESDWVDEDEDIPAFAGGLGQLGTSVGTLTSTMKVQHEEIVTLSPAPRGHRNGKRVNRSGSGSGLSSSGQGRQKSGHSPSERSTPLPADLSYDATAEGRTGRRALPAGRSGGPAFRHPIQEEDEGEEE